MISVIAYAYLGVTANWQRTYFTAVSKQILIALCAVLCVLFKDVFLSQQSVLAVMAVKSFHRHCFVCLKSSKQNRKNVTTY